MRAPTRALAAALLTAALFPTAAGCAGAVECQSNGDCSAGFICVGGTCFDPDPSGCGANAPCAAGESCCGGSCGTAPCCVIDTECLGGYCGNHRCVVGERPRCPEAICEAGVCDTLTTTCVACTQRADCPTDRECGPRRTCVSPGEGCTPSLCRPTGMFCDPQEGCRPCRPDHGDCGNMACAQDALSGAWGCVPCDASRPCSGTLTCVGGVCLLPAATPCGVNADCGARVCVAGTCAACSGPGECDPGHTCVGGDCVADPCAPNCCGLDGDCNPPATICQAGRCLPGCRGSDCATGQACNTLSGRCFPLPNGIRGLGRDCTAHDQCISGACWPVTLATQTLQLCSQACMRHDDCPSNFACWETGDANLCLPIDRIFAPPYPSLAGAPGAACDGVFLNNACRTGYCWTQTTAALQAVCMEMCGRDDDCRGLPPGDIACVSGWPIGHDDNLDNFFQPSEIDSFTQLCRAPVGHLAAHLPCASGPGASIAPDDHDRCGSGWCVQTPDFTRTPECAGPCCTPRDCDPTRPICKPIDVWDGVAEANTNTPYAMQKSCLWREYAGTKAVGDLCAADAECSSEICAAATAGGTKRCTTTCCSNDDCAGLAFAPVCRPPFPAPAPMGDSAYTAVRASLGRQLLTGTATGLAEATTSLCLPP